MDGRLFLLLDPPSMATRCRRASLREKDDATGAAFPSIDLILLSGAVRAAGFSPIFVDAQLDDLSWPELTARLRGQNIAGMVSLVSSSEVEAELGELAKLKRALDGARCYIVSTIILQLEPSRIQRLLDEHRLLDGMILNTTEHNFTEIIRPTSDEPVEPVNIAVRRGASTIVPPIKVRFGGSLHIPRPEHAIFKDRRYCFPQSKRGPVTCVQLSFGCPFTCEFCIDNQLYRKTLHRDVDDLVAELVEIDRLGFREVYFKDLTFGLNRGIVDEFLLKLIDQRLRLRWLCTTRIDVAKPELLELMKEAGCYGIEFGGEHSKESVRRRVDKHISEERIRAVFVNCRKLKIETTAFIMLAFEDDTEEDVRSTMKFALSLDPDYASFNVVNALPGTAYEARARREGFLREKSSDYGFSTSNLRHKHLTPEKIESLRREAVRSFYMRPRQILRKTLGLRSFYEFRKLIRLGLAAR